MAMLEDPPTTKLGAAESPAIRPERPRVRRLAAPIVAHPRRAGAIIVGLMLVAVAVPLLYALSAAHTTRPAAVRRVPTATATSAPKPTATPLPTGTPAPNSTPLATNLQAAAERAYVDALISHMTMDEELGQMIMIDLTNQGTTLTSNIAYYITTYQPGGVALYGSNVVTADQVKKLIVGMQQTAMQQPGAIPLLVAADQEGGDVNRLQSIIGNRAPAWAIGATNDPSVALSRGEQDKQDLASFGINMNFAPVVDVLSGPGGEFGSSARTFGATPDLVTRMASAYLQGLQDGHQVIGTLKHFPGLGDVPIDPHRALYTLTRSLADLNSIDWAPYKALIANGQVEAIMSTHVVVAAVDGTAPASLSKPVLTGVLRDQLGYDGVIITDGIYMKSLYLPQYPSELDVMLHAVEAGNDIICCTNGLTQDFFDAMHTALANGTITKARIDESVRRILLLKLHNGLLGQLAPHA